MNILKKLTIKMSFESGEIETIQKFYSWLSTKRLPSDIDDITFINEILLVLQKFESIRVLPNKKYTRTLHICELKKLLETSCFFPDNAMYEINQFIALGIRIEEALQQWEIEMYAYKEPKYKALSS